MTPAGTRRSTLALFGALCGYLALEALYVPRLPLVMDEFQGAHAAWRLLDELPYRDFAPYKTVLGYYLQLPTLAWVGDAWSALLATKLWMALLAAGALGWGAFRLRRIFSPKAVLLALTASLLMSDFLERSADLRVDAPTALVAFLGLAALLERRPAVAGLLTGAAFLVSQKALYALLAGIVGLAADGLARRDRGGILALARYGFGAAFSLGAYLAFWSFIAGPEPVLRATFLSHRRIALEDLYPGIRQEFWLQTLMRNPGFWVLAAVAVIALALRAWSEASDPRRPALLAGYGATMLALGLWHRQPWPYFFVLLVPTILVLHAALVDFALPTWAEIEPTRRRLLGALLAAFVFGWPLLRLPANLARDASAQRMFVRLGEALLPPGEGYLAGLDLLWRREQTPSALSWLDQVRLRRLRAAPAGEVEALRLEIESSPPRFLIFGGRLQALPRRLLADLGARYQPLYGNLLGFAPRIEPPGARIDWPLGGRYVVLRQSPGRVRLDGREVAEDEFAEIRPGPLEIETEVPIRLVWQPPLPPELLDDRFRRPVELFPNVYSY